MKRKLLIMALFVFIGQYAGAQDEDKVPVLKFTGFVKSDFFYDSRQSTASNGLREGHFYLYPDDVLYDTQMNDLNATPSFHILSIQTRFRADIKGPDAFGAKTSGAIEAEFFGTSESDLNGFRLRHSYIKLEWPGVSLLTGQYWHPMFPAENFPATISFNTGAPFVPFSRNPQVRLIIMAGKISITAVAYSQRDFTSSGPDGNSSKYLRNSGIPGMHLQLRLPAGESLTFWGGADYKVIRPEIKTGANILTNAIVGGFSAFASMKVKTSPVSLSLMGTYSQNGSDMVMIGGYGVSDITDPVSQLREWATINSASFWFDLTSNGKKIVPGLFCGYSKNLGSGKTIEGDVFGRGTNIDHLFRVSPRVTVTEGKVSIAAEFENTLAAYGAMDDRGRVTDTHNVTNIRLLLSMIYRF